jgi:hypothetical protein
MCRVLLPVVPIIGRFLSQERRKLEPDGAVTNAFDSSNYPLVEMACSLFFTTAIPADPTLYAKA